MSDHVDKARAWDAAQTSFQKGFSKAIEQAAQVAETGDWYGSFQTAGDERRAKAIAARIRALAGAPPAPVSREVGSHD